MKKVLLLMLTIVTLGFVAAPLSAQQTVTIGTGTSTSYSSPFDNLWKNSWCESIYLSDEIEMSGNITSIAYYYGGTATATYTYQTLKVYMGTTSRSSIANTSDWTPANDLTLVYDGTNITNPTTQGWFTIELDEPFAYDGTDNLVVVVSKTVSAYNSSYTYRYTSTSPNYLTMRRHNDSNLSYAEHPGTLSDGVIRENTRANIQLEITPGGNYCAKPTTITIGDITSTSATAAWTGGGTAWNLQYKASSDTSWTLIEDLTDSTYDLSELNPATVYQVQVQTICENDNLSGWKSTSFVTDCALLTTLPYSTDFETVASGSNPLPYCWDRGSASTTNPYAYASSAYQGSRALYFTTTNPALLPEVDPTSINLAECQISFYAKTSTAGNKLQIGVMDENGVFELVQEFPLTTTYTHYDIPLTSYEGYGTRVALRNSTTTAIYVDNLTLKAVEDCTRPVAVTCTSSETSATFSWVSTGTAFDLYYKESSESEWLLAEGVTSPYTLTGLNSNTEYKYYIQTACGLETEFTTDSATFRTLLAATTLPYEATFDEDDEWFIDNGTCVNKWMIDDIGSNVTGLFVTRDAVSKIKKYNISSHSTVSAQKTIEVGTHATFALDFDFRCGGESTYDFIKVFLAPTSSTYPASTETTAPSYAVAAYSTYAADFSEAIALLNQTNTPYKLNLTSGNTIHVSVILDNPIPEADRDENSIAKLVFLWRNDGSLTGDTTSAMISNVQLNAISCSRVSELTISDSTIDATSATISWSQGDGASTFVVQYKANGQNWSEENMIEVYDTTITLEDLNPATPYQVRVATLCGSDTSVWRSGSFTTDCAPISVPYHCDFETVPSGSNQLPYCWFKRGASSTYPYSYSSSSYAHQGSRLLYFYNYYSNCIAVLPEIDIQTIDIRDLQLSFFVKASSVNATATLEVGVMTHPDSIASFTPLFSFSPTNTYSEQVFPLMNAPEGKNYIAIRNVVTSSSASNYFYIDDLTLDYTPECMAPAALSADVQTTSADLSWTATADSYTIYYKSSSDQEFTDIQNATLDEDGVYLLEDLTPATLYQWFVVSTCADGTALSSDTVTFVTACEALTSVPQFWDFEETNNNGGTTNFPLPTCWNRITPSSSSTTLYPYSTASNPHGGSRSLYFYNYYPNAYAILPQIDTNALDIHNLQITFFSKKSSTTTGAKLVVGVMSNYTNATTFTPVDTIDLSTTYEYHVSKFDQYNGHGTYIALRNIAPSSNYTYTYVDDVTLMSIPTCNPPANVTVTPDSTYAYLNWNNMTEGSYNIYVREASSTEWTAVETGYTPEDTIFTITGLNGATDYQCYVATVCPDGDPAAAPTISFTTLCTSYPAPFAENFDAATTRPNCWAQYTGLLNSTSIAGSALTPTTSGWIFTNYYVFGHNHARINIWSTSTKYWLVSPLISLNGLENPALTFDLALTDCGNADPIEDPTAQQDDRFIVLISTDNGATWSLENATVWDNTGNGDYAYNSIATSGEQIQIPLSDYAGQNIRIAFYAESTASGGDNDLHIDNVSVNESVSCLKPGSLTVSDIHNDRATVSWSQNDESDSWLVEYDTAGFQPGTGIEVEVNGEPTLDLTQLLATTTYDVYVKTVCADAPTGYTEAVKVTFTTRCDPIDEIPQTWDFEANNTAGTSSYPMPACWSKFPVSGTYPYVYNSSTSAHAGSRYLYFYNGTKNTYAILKELDVETYPINTLMLSFYAKASSASAIASLEVGVMTSPTDTSSFVPVMTLSNLPTTYGSTPFIVPFNSYEGEGSYIALRNVFEGSASNSFYIDDMTLNFLPDCITPINVHADNVTSNSITLAWTADEDDSQWEIAYAAHAFNPDTVTAILVDENPFLVEGLTDNTTYQFYVRTICSDNEPSDWSLPVSITTPCVPVVVTEDEPFMENFNTLTSGIPGCWDNSEGTTTDASYKWNYYATGETGHCLRFNSYVNSNGKTNMLKTPVMDLSQITTAQLSFSYKNPTGGDFSVYLSTDGGATYTTPLLTGLTGVSSWTTATCYFNGSEGNNNVVVVFKGTSNYGNGDAYIYLDSVVVKSAASCATPSQLAVTDLTNNSVTLSWGALAGQENWEILYGQHGFNPATAGTPIPNVTTNPYTVTGLTSLTNYDFYVRAICGTDDVSEWSDALSVTTAMESVNLPYSTTFEATSDQQWLLNNGSLTNHWTMGTVSGHGALFVTKDSLPNYTNSSATIMAEKSFNMPATDSVHVEFDLKVGGEANTNYTYDYLKVFLAPANAVFTAGANQNDYSHSDSSRYAMNFSAYGSQLGAPNHPYSACLSTGTIHISQNMPIPANSSTAKLVFLWRNDSSSGDGNSAIISNFSIAPVGSTPVVTLPSVTTVAADPVGQTTATLNATITNPDGVAITGKGFQWKVNGGDYQNVTGSGSGNTFVANLTNLTANTQYFFKAYIMTADTTVYGEELSFTTSSTPTPPATPTVTTNDATYTQTTATLNATITNPDGVSITGKGFQWKVNGGNYQDAAGTGTGNDFSAELTNLTPSTQYFFKAYITTADTTVYGAELSFTTLPEDVEPCATPTGVTTSDITKESIKVSWDDVEGITWKVQYRPVNGTFTSAEALTNSYVMPGLNPETTYEIQVQANCGNDNVSAWTEIVTATTLADGVNSYLENSVVLYPNPAKEVINVQCTMNDAQWNGATIEVLDVYGKLLQTLKADSEITQINVSNLANGMYFVRMTTEQGVVTKRFVKK